MSNNVEELLNAGISRLTADAEVPPGLLARARRRNRRRRTTILAAAAAGTAAVTAAAVIAATSGPPAGTGTLDQQTISYVTTHAEQALAGITQANAIQVDTETANRRGDFGLDVLNMNATGAPGSPSAQTGLLGNVDADRIVDWTDSQVQLERGFSVAGKLVFASSIGTVTSKGKKIDEAYGAAYPARTQWHSPLTGSWVAPGGDTPTCQEALIDPGSANFKASVTKALSCHLYSLGGHQEINGVDTIKLVLKPQPGVNVRQTVWIDPSSYLPVRTVVTLLSALSAHARPAVLTENFQWLPRTAANLAALNAAIRRSAIPAGFRSLPASDLPLDEFHGPPGG